MEFPVFSLLTGNFKLRRVRSSTGESAANPVDDQLARLIQCAPTARNTSGGGFPPDSCRFDLVADERLCRVTGRAEAS